MTHLNGSGYLCTSSRGIEYDAWAGYEPLTHEITPKDIFTAFTMSIGFPDSSRGGEMENVCKTEEMVMKTAASAKKRPGQMLAVGSRFSMLVCARARYTHRRPYPNTIVLGSLTLRSIFPSLRKRSGLNVSGSW